ncbi:hypothetical protein ASPZODRAFT_69492 [Penicilliopsis zonata CBS 506.65]|uniref:Major facilitator superfamily (MFS) profile domain-containing protein n=1 Tax=Penicilliopsis zonata CBS 506.65 TaxID=1073090 RepID=A0A1L9SDM4_9EURO|nr:hypothetical protein ASPZODRAFT_69492 [Penicilliopsis zonata CBS 506.65]OJJ45187.1 hypothetical protein ASPZODRAFT_69492 [Penicilliopsis zonata CBS 506.65]
MADIAAVPEDRKTGEKAGSIHEQGSVELVKGDTDDVDEAFAVFQGHQEVVVDAATDKRLLRKIDRYILPVMCLIYGMNYLDKTTLSYSSVMGITEDLHLEGTNYSWLGSIFYFGYLGFEWPTVRLLQALPIAKYSAMCVIIWGVILTLFSVTHNFAGAAVLRVFLGIFEAAVTPGWTLITSQWYKKSEQGARTCIWFSFNGAAAIAGGFIAYGLADAGDRGHFTIAAWKVLYILTGLLTVALGIFFLIIVPDSPLKAWWLSDEDRILAVARVRENQQGIGNKHFKMYQFLEALKDPFAWAIVVLSLAGNIPNGGISNFFSLLIVSFGYTAKQSLLLSSPSGAVEVVSLLLTGWLGDRCKNRLLISLGGVGLGTIGSILLVALSDGARAGKLVGFYLTLAAPSGFVIMLSLISSNIAGYTKKTTVAAMYLISYCVGNIVGPQTFRPEDAPHYYPAIVTMFVCYVICILDILFIWYWFRRMNAKKAAIRADPSYVKPENSEWLDLTDGENPEFLYTL